MGGRWPLFAGLDSGITQEWTLRRFSRHAATISRLHKTAMMQLPSAKRIVHVKEQIREVGRSTQRKSRSLTSSVNQNGRPSAWRMTISLRRRGHHRHSRSRDVNLCPAIRRSSSALRVKFSSR